MKIKLKKYIISETRNLQDSISSLKSKVPSKVIKIKLNEVVNLLNDLSKKHVLEDKDVLTMLRYYELVEVLKKPFEANKKVNLVEPPKPGEDIKNTFCGT